MSYKIHANPDTVLKNFVSIDPGLYTFSFRIEYRTRKRIRTIAMWKLNLKKFTEYTLSELNSKFNEYHKQISKCDTFIIESQLYIAKTAYIRIFQHSISYFMLKYPKMCIVEVNSKLKGNVFGWNKKRLKQESIKTGWELLEERGDTKGLEILQNYQDLFDAETDKKKKNIYKLDDPTDTICQIEALVRLLDEQEV